MSIHLRLRIVLTALIGALLVVCVGTALKFRELAISASAPTPPTEAMEVTASTAAIGLGALAAITVLIGAAVLRSLRRGFLDRLHVLELAAIDVEQGDDARRVPPTGDDELSRIARALNLALDLRDRSVAELSGRNREMRALLVALLRQWPGPIAITGIDGELLASTLKGPDEERLRSLTPQVRKAAGILLSRGFVSAAELVTDIHFSDGVQLHIQALALGEHRIVGWLAEFRAAKVPAPTVAQEAAELVETPAKPLLGESGAHASPDGTPPR